MFDKKNIKKIFLISLITGIAIFFTGFVYASGGGGEINPIDLTAHWIGFLCLGIFVVSYMLVMTEEIFHLRKSKPVVVSAGLIWLVLGFYYRSANDIQTVETLIRHSLLEFAELFLFLLVAMTYINAMSNRKVFEWLRSFLVSLGFSYRKLFWITGIIAFFMSPIADNLTTALVMGAVILSVGRDNKKFIGLSFINVVVAANAGGAFSPFGDITTLMVWQKGIIDFWGFFTLFVPSVVNYVVPALIIQFFIPNDNPPKSNEKEAILFGGKRIVLLFILTISTAVFVHSFLHIPPFMGMMIGMGYLMFFSFYIKKVEHKKSDLYSPETGKFDIFRKVSKAEWDTLFFFFGIILSVGGLALIGYLSNASVFFYENIGVTTTNILVGVFSAIIDNIPVMFAVLTMLPDMNEGQWLLVTLTAGVGGSMLSIGSAAGVALMGQSQGNYTFFSHLKWTPVIALGYVASIATLILMQGEYF